MEVLAEVDLKANWRTVGSSLPNPEQSQEDDVSLMASLVRDLVIVAVALVVWLGYAQWSSELSIATDDWLRTPVGIVIGLLVVLKFHEWGHFSGARVFGGAYPYHETFRSTAHVPV